MGSVKWVPGVSTDNDDDFFFDDDVKTTDDSHRALGPAAPEHYTPEAEPEGVVASPERATFTERFSAWASKRPFAAGLLMILAGVVILTPAYMSFEVSNIQVQIATMSGVSTLLIGVLLMCCGLMAWFQPEGRLLAGVAAIILAVVAIPTSNFGGFIVGALLALIGGALALSWAPGTKPPRRSRRSRRAEATKER